MDPAKYLHQSRSPILELLIEYALERAALSREECVTARDLRGFLNKLTQGLQKKINDDAEVLMRTKLVHERRVLIFMVEVLNTHAHEHDRDTRNLALAISSSVDFFLQSYRPKSENGSLRKLLQINESLFRSITSEYVVPENPQSEEEDFGARFDSLHDKLDKILLNFSASDSSTAAREQGKEQSVRSRLEELRQEIEDAAKERGREMKGYHHLLQWGRMNDLISKAPKTTEDLHEWSATLPRYTENKRWFDRQIDRWGNEITKLFGEKQ
ncbi:hypothetical protein ABWH93_17705 [Seohaeicola saemankumensis]|uniref:hypothetical protein n=1 Tax=Seohaeicola TaxID=481178 RepID=UPI0035D0484A